MQRVDPAGQVNLADARVAALLRRWGVQRARLFGSALRNELRTESDLDVLVEFQPGRTPGFGFFELEQELTDLLGRKVDLNTETFLSPYFRDQVLAEARVIYDAS